MAKELTVVTVAYGRPEHVRKSLLSIVQGTDVDHHLIVVDNGNRDGTLEVVREVTKNVSSLEIIANVENLGAARGFNQGFERAETRFVARIDSDVVVPVGWASAILRDWWLTDQLAMLTTNLVPMETASHQVGIGQPCVPTYFTQSVWHDSGLGSWCCILATELGRRIGWYDESFGLYALNDNDWEKRAMLAGFRLATASRISVGHLWSNRDVDEATYNHWKIGEYNQKITRWCEKWGAARW
jgi:GT2 family glycosyltransferase